MKLLLVEDSLQLNKALTTLLSRNSYVVDSAFDGEEALSYILEYTYDVIILDIMLPKIDGLEVLKKARRNGIKTPIIMLTAKSTVEDKILGLDLGADDYLPKPFNSEELLARIRALGRRNVAYDDKEELTFGDLKLDLNTSTLYKGEKSVALTNKEMQLFVILMNANGNLVNQDFILNKIWNEDSYSTSDNIWVFISYLRRKLESLKSNVEIKSIRFQGYYLEVKNA